MTCDICHLPVLEAAQELSHIYLLNPLLLYDNYLLNPPFVPFLPVFEAAQKLSIAYKTHHLYMTTTY
jgi:hypothetical protein